MDPLIYILDSHSILFTEKSYPEIYKQIIFNENTKSIYFKHEKHSNDLNSSMIDNSDGK
jgi:hypothetical protein